MSSKAVIMACQGRRVSPQRRPNAPRPVVQVAAVKPASKAHDCINCTDTGYKPSETICTECGHVLGEEVVDSQMLATAITNMTTARPPAADGHRGHASGKVIPAVLLAYNDSCRQHFDQRNPGTIMGRDHPERPERASAIMAHLQATSLLARCLRTRGREATLEELLAVHDKALLAAVEKASRVAGQQLRGRAQQDGGERVIEAAEERLSRSDRQHIQDVYFNAATAACARVAAGCAAEVARHVVTGSARHGAAIIRPPGHHAESATAMGFCYYNNAAVAARAAQAAGARRVAVVDWDVHHGNGTQQIFEEDPSVLYLSTHRYDEGCFYPRSGNYSEVGYGPGRGFTVNVPWNAGYGRIADADMLAAFRHVITPIVTEFRPDIVIVSAGFDAAEGDPLGGCLVSSAAFGHLTAQLCALAPTVLLLEGGYNLTVTAAATEECLRVLLGEDPRPLPAASGDLTAALTAVAQRTKPSCDEGRRSSVAGEGSGRAAAAAVGRSTGAAESPYWTRSAAKAAAAAAAAAATPPPVKPPVAAAPHPTPPAASSRAAPQTPQTPLAPPEVVSSVDDPSEDDPWVASGLEGVLDSALESVLSALRVHEPFWKAAARHLKLLEVAADVRLRLKLERRRREKEEAAKAEEEAEVTRREEACEQPAAPAPVPASDATPASSIKEDASPVSS